MTNFSFQTIDLYRKILEINMDPFRWYDIFQCDWIDSIVLSKRY